MTVHDSSGKCPKCAELMNLYPGINKDLRAWFEAKQKQFPNFHVAEGGRGRARQNQMLAEGRSRAGWGQSAHNYNCAIDTFFMVKGQYSLDEKLYAQVVKDLPKYITWYGAPGAEFYERPHFQKADWRALAKVGAVSLVEGAPAKKAA